MTEDKSKRYQYQPWYVKLWRRRHMLSVPTDTLRLMIKKNESFHVANSIAIGLAHCKMNWLHDFDWSKYPLDDDETEL